MKTIQILRRRKSVMLTMLSILFATIAFSQVKIDTLRPAPIDTLVAIPSDTLLVSKSDTLQAVDIAPAVVPAVVDPVVAEPAAAKASGATEASPSAQAETQQAEGEKTEKKKDEKKDKKGKKNEIILYAGANFTNLSASTAYESEAAAGYQLGAYYKQGRMFYWQAGARLANAMIGYKPANSTSDFENISVIDLDLPLTLGINFTSFMNRVLSLRLFASAVPAINLNVGDNNSGIAKSDINSFVLYGQGGLGINVAFLVIEAGYNYGFNELLVGNTDSKPGQVFINLGFRF